MRTIDKIPLRDKLNLTIKEAAEYSNIGENTLRSIIANDSNLSFVMYVGKKVLIKRKEFEEWNTNQFIVR